MRYILLVLSLSGCASLPAFDASVFSQGMSQAYLNQQSQNQPTTTPVQKVQLVDQYGRPIQFER